MNARALRRYVDDLLRGRRPKPFRPNDFEAAQFGIAIDVQAARVGTDRPRQEFLSELHRRLPRTGNGIRSAGATGKSATTRRQIIVGTCRVVTVTADRLLFNGRTAQ